MGKPAAPVTTGTLGWGCVAGHAAVIQALRQALSGDRLGPALLLSGPASVGKTLLAEVLAQAALCRQPNGPCGTCRVCVAVGQHAHPDCVWLEPASPTAPIAIDHVRELLRQLHQTPLESTRHLAVVLAIEQLSDDAATTLLKTLEEPPPHAHLILTTNDPGRCLPTILSRCQTLRVAPLGRATLAGYLVRAHHMAPETAGSIAALAGGRVGLALRLLAADSADIGAFFQEVSGSRDWSSDRRAELHALCERYLWWCRDALCRAADCTELATTPATEGLPSAQSLDGAMAVTTEALELLEALAVRVNPKLIHWKLQQRWLDALPAR